MPELPEVETVRRSLLDSVVGQRISGLRLGDFPGVLADQRAEDVLARIAGREIAGIHRRAKYLIVDLDDGTAIVVHLRMTGRLTLVDRSEPPLRFERRLPLPAPVDSVEALGFGVNRLVDDLAGWLLARGLGVVRMSLTLVHERYLRERGMPPTTATFALGAPARTPAHLHAVLRERLARVALPAPVEAIVLSSDETAPLASRNLGLLPEDAADAVVVPLVERLRSRLGDHAVATLAMRAEHRPEQAASEVPVLSRSASFAHSGTGSRATRARANKTPASPRADAAQHPPAPAAAPRPLWLLDMARPLGGVVEAKPWVLRDGPERIESGWWDGRDCRRDYFVAETADGEMAWIYRDHRYGTDDGEWFMHGLFA